MTATAELVGRIHREFARAGDLIGGVEIDAMNGDNLAVTLCSHFEDADEEQDENGWTESATTGCDLTLKAIHAVYVSRLGPVFADVATTIENLAAALAEARDDVRLWKCEAADRSEGMVQLNLDRAAMGVENLQLSERATAAEAERDEMRAVLSDPSAVHINMLRGGIAKPSVANIIHLYGDQVLCAAEERDRYKAALEPFADAAEDLNVSDDALWSIWERPEAMNITVGHLRAAAQALSRDGGGE